MHRGWTNVQEKFAQACYDREHVIEKKDPHRVRIIPLSVYHDTFQKTNIFGNSLLNVFFFPNKQTYNYYGLRKQKAPTAIIEQQ